MPEKKTKKPGRPVLPENQAKAQKVQVRFRPGEISLLEKAAKKDGITVSHLIRRALKSILDKAMVLL